MDDGTEGGVFLWRSADNRERPDGIIAMVDGFYIHHRKRMCQTVVSQVIAKRAFR